MAVERFAGRYALLRELGQGGMGTVYLARDLSTGTECALKRLDPRIVHIAPNSLQREFELLTRVRHPAVVGVYEFGFAPDATPFYTMEYIPGVPADRIIGPGDPRDWGALCFLAAHVTHGLEALHGAGVIHGDLKPSNLLVVPSTTPGFPPAARLVDFGLAALLGRDREGRRGTPGYAAPEVARGEPPSVASDLYGLGATLYTLAAGQPPFGRRDGAAVHRPQNGLPSAIRLEEAGTPPGLVQLIVRLMAPSPDERPSDAREVRRELERIHPASRRSLAHRLQTESVVGRERELARLELLMTAEVPSVILLAGEAGMGKSALLGELAVRASLHGRAVFRLGASGSETPGMLSAALLRRLAAESNATADGTDLSRRAITAVEASDPPRDEATISLLADAAASWGRSIHRRGATPLVLLDDWDRFDSISRAAVRRIALHPDASMFRWVWASRGEALSEDDRVLLDAGQARRLTLGPLDRDGAVRLVAARLHGTPPANLGEFLWSRAGGHPGLLVEFLRVAADRGAIRESELGLSAPSEALEALELPDDFELSLQARLSMLSGRARSAATALAVWNRFVPTSELQAIAPEAGEEGVAELVDAGLATRNGDHLVMLGSVGLGRRLLGSLDVEERRRLHRAVLDRPGLTATERFAHFRGAGMIREALASADEATRSAPDERLVMEAAALAESDSPEVADVWLERAGRILLEQGRHRAAIPYLERSVASTSAAARVERWYLLSRAYMRAGRPEDVASVVARALAEEPSQRFRSLLLNNDAARLSSQGQLETAQAKAREALDVAQTANDEETAGLAALTLGSVLLMLGRPDEARTFAEQAQEASDRSGHRLGWTRATGLRAAASSAQHDLPEAERLFKAALAISREHGLRLATEELLMSFAALLTEAGRWGEAREAYDEAARIALEDGRRRGAALALANLAQSDGLTGRATRALTQARSAVRLTRAYLPRIEPFAWRSLAQAHRIMGRSRRAERAARKALMLALQLRLDEELDWSRIEYGRLCEAAGRWKEAEDVWSRALESPRAHGSVGAIVLAALAGRAAVRRRDFEAVAARLSTCDEWLRGRPAGYANAHVLQLRAEASLAQGHPDAFELARKAMTALGALPAPADRAAAALELARIAMNARADQDAPIDEWLHEAASTFERLGDHRSRERALGLVVEWLRRNRAAGTVTRRDRGLIESVSRLLDSLADLRELSQRAMAMAVEQLDAERGVLLLADSQSGALQPVVEHGAVDGVTRDQAMGYSRQAVERAVRSARGLLISDAPSDPEAMSDSVVDLGLRSIVCVPLYVGGKVVGAVYLDDSRRSDTFSEADRGLLEGFAHLMAIAIEKSRGHEEVVRANEALVDENLSLRREVGVRFQPRNFIGVSTAMQQVLAVVERAAQIPSTVLLTGENGTGKEMIARILHHNGRRRLGSFVAVNCGAIPETLLESELFGILPNVATGVRGREGRFVQAEGGTLFLDEIGEMPLQQQVALLSAIANREITPVGGGPPISVDVRIIVATNSDLRKKVEEGSFREDLYYRLNVIPIEVPPLRERKADIPALARYFASHFAEQQERKTPDLSPEFLAALMQSDWPGNVRELQNYIERVIAMTPGEVLYPQPLPHDVAAQSPRVRLERGRRLANVIGDLERQLIREALDRFDGNQSRAARALGIPEQSLRYRLRKYAMPSGRRFQRARRKSR